MILDIHSNSFSQKLKIDTKCYHLLAIILFQHSKLENFCIFVISINRSFISQNLKIVSPLGGKFDFFSPPGFEIQSDFNNRTSKSNSTLSEL